MERVGIEDLLAWYRDAGVDEPLAEAPVDRFAQTEAAVAERAARKARAPVERAPAETRLPTARTPTGTVRTPSGKARAPVGGDDAAALARAAIEGCDTLDALQAAITGFDACPLRDTARSTVFAAGDPAAPLMIVGDVPDRDEDAGGEPFAGPAGAVLDRMLAAIGTDRGSAYLAVASPWRTPGQRVLNPREKTMLAPFLQRHVALARPATLLVMGSTACELLWGPTKRMTALRGRVRALEIEGDAFEAFVTFHPNFLMRQPEQKRLAWMDLLLIKDALAETGTRS